MKRRNMKSIWVLASLFVLGAFALPPLSAAEAAIQKQFSTPQEAVDRLIQAAAAFDTDTLKEILGSDSGDLITSEDSVADKNRATAFATKAKEKSSIEPMAKNPNRMMLIIGNDRFEFPIPLLKSGGQWHFDAKGGRDEILRRRIGANELDAIEICRGYVEAQKEYAADKHDDSKVHQYAQKIVSTEGRQDGLAWRKADGSWGGPVGELVAKAIEEGNIDASKPYHGYYFKILNGQGSAAPMGQMEYVADGKMTAGFALAAAPAEYRVTGVKTFIVNHDGKVYEKDLGKETLPAFQKLNRYNPDKSWSETREK